MGFRAPGPVFPGIADGWTCDRGTGLLRPISGKLKDRPPGPKPDGIQLLVCTYKRTARIQYSAGSRQGKLLNDVRYSCSTYLLEK